MSKTVKLAIATIIALTGYITILSLIRYQQPYLTVSEAIASPKKNIEMKIAGKIVAKSLGQNKKSGTYRFQIADQKNHITVFYNGILPDLFQDQGEIVVTGRFKKDPFYATNLLTTCPSKYQKNLQQEQK